MSTIHREWSTIQKNVRTVHMLRVPRLEAWNHRKGCSTIPVVRLHTRICVNGGRAAAHRLRLPRGEAAAAGTEPVSASRRRTTSTWLPLRSSSCPCCRRPTVYGWLHSHPWQWHGMEGWESETAARRTQEHDPFPSTRLARHRSIRNLKTGGGRGEPFSAGLPFHPTYGRDRPRHAGRTAWMRPRRLGGRARRNRLPLERRRVRRE